MKTISIPLPETIGTMAGYRGDGVLVGSITPLNPDKIFYRSKFLAGVQFFTSDNSVSGTTLKEVTTAATNDAVGDTTLFPNPSVGDAFVSMIPSASTMDEIHFRVSTAGSGITYAHEYWATDNSWKPLTILEGGSPFLQSTGIIDFEFTVPADWGSRPIDADTGTFYGKVIRSRILAVSSPVSPVCTRLYPGSTSFTTTDVTSALTDLSISAPSTVALTGERWCSVSTERPYGLKIVYREAQEGGNNKLAYLSATDTAVDIVGYSDTSSGMTDKNERTFTPKRLTASAASGTAVTVQKLTADGYVESGVNAVPTASTGRFSIGLSNLSTGNMSYELKAEFTGGNPRLTVYENNVFKYTHTVNITTADKLRVYRYANTVSYMLGDNVIYTSLTTTMATLFGRFLATDNGVIIPNIRFVDFSGSDAIPLTATYTVTNMAATDESSATEQFLAKHYLRFEPPAGFVSLTAAQSGVNQAGYELCLINTHPTTQIESLAKIQNYQILPITGANVEGISIQGSASYTSFVIQLIDPAALTQSAGFLVLNGSTGVFTPVTYPALDDFATIAAAIGFTSGQKLLVLQWSGNTTADVGVGSYLMLAEA